MNDEAAQPSREAYDGVVSITTNAAAFKLFNEAFNVARGLDHLSIDPIHVVIAALEASNVYWKFARQVAPVTYSDAVRAARQHYSGPVVVGGDAAVGVNLTPYTPAFSEVAARLNREQHQWISEQLASYSNGVDTKAWAVRDMLLTFCAESDSPAVKALELQASTSSV